MRRFAETAEAIAGTASRLKKAELLAEYFRTLEEPDLRASAVFFTGRPFALTDARTLNAGWSALINAVQQISGASDEAIHDVYLDRGDLGEAAERLLAGRSTGGALSPAEIKYAIKIVTGDLRIGLKENTVEEAIAKAFDRAIEAVRRAGMILGDIGETAVLARRGELDQIALCTFRPVKFMLATPIDTEEEIFAAFPGPFYIEDKYDGIRGQLHVSGGRAALYSRTLDDVSQFGPRRAFEDIPQVKLYRMLRLDV